MELEEFRCVENRAPVAFVERVNTKQILASERDRQGCAYLIISEIHGSNTKISSRRFAIGGSWPSTSQ